MRILMAVGILAVLLGFALPAASFECPVHFTQAQAAKKIFSDNYISWQNYELGKRTLHPGLWWCFLQRTKHLRAKSRQSIR